MADMNKIYERLGEIQSDVKNIQKVQDEEIKPAIEDYKKMKNRTIGAVVMSMFSGTTIGAFASQLIEIVKH